MLAKQVKQGLLKHYQLCFILHPYSGQQLRHNVVRHKNMKQYFIIILSLLFFQIVAAQQIPPVPSSYLAQGGEYLAEIFPAKSRMEINSNSICYFYKVKHLYTYEDYDPADRFQLIWQNNLVYKDSPSDAIISRNGYLVTFDDYRHLGSDHSLVIYNLNGELIKDFKLEELIPYEEINKYIYDFKRFESLNDRSNIESTNAIQADTNINRVNLSNSALEDINIVPSFGVQINWRYNARYFFTNPSYQENEQSWWYPSHLYILLSYQKVIEIFLNDGANKYGELVEFPHLERLLKKQFLEDETKINKTSIEFSSVTELLKCLK